MPSLKQEMREMFERRSAMEFNERNSLIEDGLLEKIINLAFANLSPYNGKRWQITLLRNPTMLQRLYRNLEDRRILDSASALLIAEPVKCEPADSGIDLLLMSLSYAAKYYCLESFFIKNFSGEMVVREFSLDRNCPVLAVAGIGIYRDAVPPPYHARYVYSDIVKEL